MATHASTSPAMTTNPEAAGRPDLPDAVRVQILATEHWSLLATRTMTWNEIFSRMTIFLTVLSAAVVSIALVAQATDFGDNFRLFALLVLPVVLLIGIATLIRLVDTQRTDFLLIASMNRLRRAYIDLAPDLEPYFTSGLTDDLAGIAASYYRPQTTVSLGLIMSSSPMLVGIIDSLLAGLLAAIIVETLGATTALFVVAGIIVALLGLAIMIALPYRQISKLERNYEPRFPDTNASRS